MYTIMGMLFIVGWIVVKALTLFMSKADKSEINTMYKSMKPNRKDW